MIYTKNVLLTIDRFEVLVNRYLLFVFVLLCALQGRSNGRPIPTACTNNYTSTDNKTIRVKHYYG